MDRRRPRPRTSRVLPLIVLSQASLSLAYPFVNQPWPNTSAPAGSNPYQQGPRLGFGGPGPAYHNVEGVSTTATWANSDWTSGPPAEITQTKPVYQIGDGQIQAWPVTETTTETSGTEVFVSTTTVTNWQGSPPNSQSWSTSWTGPWTNSGWTTSTVPWTSSSSWSSSSSPMPISSTSALSSSPSTSSTSSTSSSSSSTTSSTSSSSSSASSSTLQAAITTTAATAGAGGTTITETLSTTDTVSSTTTIAPVIITTVPSSVLTSLTTSEVQSAMITFSHNTTGSVITSLETSGNPSSLPFQTSIITVSPTLSLVNTSTISVVAPTLTSSVTPLQVSNIFAPIATDQPPAQVTTRTDYPVPTTHIQPQAERYETNKFYANFFLGDQMGGTWTHPYSVSWSKGAGETNSWGIAVSHIERNQLATGAKNPSLDAGDVAFFVAPIGLQSLVLSAVELQSGTTLTTDTLTGFSINVNLVPAGASSPIVTFPMVQGMAFVTANYSNAQPIIQSGLGIVNVTYVGEVVQGIVYKYRAVLNDGFTWVIYVTPSSPDYPTNSFTVLTSGTIAGPQGFSGTIQVAKVPPGVQDAESVYDSSAGAYPTGVNITGSVSGTAGTYVLSRTKAGVSSQNLLVFALPHQVSSFSDSTSSGLTEVQLVTVTKGMATAVKGDSWTLVEPNLPIDMTFAPWSAQRGTVNSVSSAAVQAINEAGLIELSEDVAAQCNVGSLYFDGKALAKFAAIIYAVNDLGGNTTLALSGLAKLENAFATHVNNQMTYPLVYDAIWGGAVSVSTYLNGNAGDDFGNTLYNDHHFHYGYFVYAAAVIGYIRPAWLDEGTNKAWVNMLVRDYANSIDNDPYFPFQRMFDWYNGHSWAHGLIESADGKDQESSSEDTMASYALKMWGKVIGDSNMEARGNLMLAVQQRALQDYYLYSSNNTVEPSNFIGNKAAGILFENKIDHTTYFGAEPEYIEGIHMLPLMPHSPYIRDAPFVSQEWDAYFGPGGIKPVSQVSGGWQGILMANLAIIDPVTSYNYFSNATGNFTYADLDGGASQTWYLAWTAALGGSYDAAKAKREEELDRRHVWRRNEKGARVGDEYGYIERKESVRSSRLRRRTRGRGRGLVQ